MRGQLKADGETMPDEAGVILEALAEVMDPEIPVVSLMEMGIIREVSVAEGCAKVVITPTFSGCPALEVMKKDISNRLRSLGYTQFEIVVTLSPPWTTDWITESAKSKLKNFGITPPKVHNGAISTALLSPAECPYCGSIKTTLRNSFGPTPCRMILTCGDCGQPFEQFKPL